MLYELIVVGGFLFWFFFLIISIAIITALDWDRGKEATLCLAVFLVVMALFSNANPFTWMADNPVQTVLLIIGYFVIGGLWAIAKWYLFVKKRMRKYIRQRTSFLIHKGIEANHSTAVPSHYRRDWEARIRMERIGRPEVSNHKGTIMMWMTYWPWSMFWTLLQDAIRESFTFVYERIGGLLGRISDRVYRNVESDYRNEEAPKSVEMDSGKFRSEPD